MLRPTSPLYRVCPGWFRLSAAAADAAAAADCCCFFENLTSKDVAVFWRFDSRRNLAFVFFEMWKPQTLLLLWFEI